MAKRLIFSDLHFGDPMCSLRREAVTKGLRQFIRDLQPVDELILAGDILDANISSLTLAIEGKKGSGLWPKQLGFRDWLAFIFEGRKFKVDRIVYTPGNHDYIIWNILATNRAFVQPISQGRVPTKIPLMEDTFTDPFIQGVAPKWLRDRFIVVYPNYEFKLAGRKVLVTHGHYLDEKQTLFKNLKKLIHKAGGNERRAVRKFFIGTAQYQAVANSVSYQKKSRELVDRAHKKIGDLWNAIDIIGKLRNQPIDKEMLKAIEMYLRYFCDKEPDVFVFGHTHEAGYAQIKAFRRKKGRRPPNKSIEVWNDGSFIIKGGTAGTFLVADDDLPPEEMIKIYKVGSKGKVQVKNV